MKLTNDLHLLESCVELHVPPPPRPRWGHACLHTLRVSSRRRSTIGWLHAVVLAKAAATVQTKPMNALKVSFTWALEV